MENVTNTLYNSNDCRNICDNWCRKIFQEFDRNIEKFKCEKKDDFEVYTYVDKDHKNLEEIKKFMVTKKIPDIFGYAQKLCGKIVPVFQIKARKAKRIRLYFALEDKIDDCLNDFYLVRDTSLGDLYPDDDD